MSPLHLKAIAGAVLAAAAISVFLAYRSSLIEYGRELERAANAAARAKHDAGVEKQDLAAANISRETGHAIEDQRARRATEGDHARAVIRPVRVCEPAGDRRQVAEAARAAAATDGTATAAELSLRPRNSAQATRTLPDDIGPALISLMESCQRDHDDAQQWRAWWRRQQELAAAPPS